ncbi:putative reverse transcriptase domain-containing protein [Tanacetum coccineum]
MVSEPLRAMVMGAPLWDARHQNYDCSVLRHNALRPKRGTHSIKDTLPLAVGVVVPFHKVYNTSKGLIMLEFYKEPQVVDEFIDVCDGSMIRSECLESHVRDELNKTASRTMVVLHPLKVVITNLDAGLVVDHDAKKWPNAPDDDASSHYKVECWQNYRLWDFGKLHWVAKPSPAVDPLKVEVRLIVENLRTGFEDLNPESKVVLPCAYGVPSLKFAEVGDTFQFERRRSTPEKLLFNRTIALPSTYKPGSNGIMDLFALASHNGHGGEEGITRTLSLYFTAARYQLLRPLAPILALFSSFFNPILLAYAANMWNEALNKRHGTKIEEREIERYEILAHALARLGFIEVRATQQNRRQETARAYAAAPTENRGYAGNLPKCNRCNFHHSGRCPPKCQKCQRTGHLEKDCRAILPGACNDFLQNATCYGCGEKGHLKNKCPKAGNQHNEGARARAYVVVENPQQNPNVVTGTFLLNDHYACILFDSGAEKSFVSSAFTPFIDIAPTALNTSYEVELADGKVVSTNTVLRSCTLVLLNHVFKIDLLPTRLGSFDVIIGMDWLSYHRAVIDCYEKIIRIPLPNGEILEVQGERPKKDPGSLACIKADEKKLDDIRVVRDFPEVFPDDLSGLPPVREIEFRIDLIPGASPVVKSPYRLAPSEMLELSNQLKELQEKGFIRPSHSPWGAPDSKYITSNVSFAHSAK